MLMLFEFFYGSSDGNASDYNVDARGFALQTGRPFIGSPSLNGYCSLTGNLPTEEKRTGPNTPPFRLPRLIGAATCTSATVTEHATSVFFYIYKLKVSKLITQ